MASWINSFSVRIFPLLTKTINKIASFPACLPSVSNIISIFLNSAKTFSFSPCFINPIALLYKIFTSLTSSSSIFPLRFIIAISFMALIFSLSPLYFSKFSEAFAQLFSSKQIRTKFFKLCKS